MIDALSAARAAIRGCLSSLAEREMESRPMTLPNRLDRFPVAIRIAIVLIAALLPAAASDEIPAPPQKHPIALVGATIHPVDGPVIENGILVFDRGVITAMGVDVAIPDGAERIDVSGRHVYPALIAANTVLGLVEISAVRATRDYDEAGDISPEVRAEVAYNPDSELLPVTRASGVALAQSVPGGGRVSGTSALMMLDGWTWEDATLKAPIGLHVRWPSMRIVERRGSSAAEQRQRRDEAIASIRTLFSDARAWRAAVAAHENGRGPAPETSTRFAAMAPVLAGEVPVFVHADDIRQIQAALDWSAEEGLRMVLVGGYDAWRMADELKARQIPVIYDNVHSEPRRRWEGYDAAFTAPAKLHAAGVAFCIGTSGSAFGAAHTRSLPHMAATAAAYGLPPEEALRAVTLYPARILGVADRVGSLTVGKDATLIVTSGDPLELTTGVERQFIQGRPVDLRNRHTRLYEKYREKYRQMELLAE